MNKTTKASIATAAGIVLLLGGGASLAYWTDSENVGSTTQTITAGTLDIAPLSSGAWTKSFNGATPATAVTLGSFAMVPGDKLTYTQTFTITATGDDLLFTIKPTDPTLGAGALADQIDFDAPDPVLSGATGIALAPSGTDTYAVTGTGTATLTVTWTVDWPFGDATSVAGDNLAKGATLTLSNGAVVLTQVATVS